MDRENIRREILADRDKAALHTLAVNSALIGETLFNLAEIKAAKTIMFYANFKSEVQTADAIARSLKEGLRVVLPLSLVKERRLRPYLIKNQDTDLKPGFCSIPEPDPDFTTAINPAEIDVIIVPGSVFDHNGGRLGYGGGFYDRFLANQAPTAFRIGLAFELQIVAGGLPLAPHDQPIDCLVSEKKTYRFMRSTHKQKSHYSKS